MREQCSVTNPLLSQLGKLKRKFIQHEIFPQNYTITAGK
jgi:hypothetical protein